MCPIEWTEFTFTCEGCQRPTRLDRATLLEQNAVNAALGRDQTLGQTAAEFLYCGACNGTPVAGEHDTPPAPIDPADPGADRLQSIKDPAAEWLQAIKDGKWPPQQDDG